MVEVLDIVRGRNRFCLFMDSILGRQKNGVLNRFIIVPSKKIIL